MFGVLVSMGKKGGKVSDAGTWALESFCIKKEISGLKKAIQTVLNYVSLASKQKGHLQKIIQTMCSLTADKDDAGPDCGGVDLSVKF